MAKKHNKKHSSSSSRKAKPAKVTRKPQSRKPVRKPAPIKRKAYKPTTGKKPTTARGKKVIRHTAKPATKITKRASKPAKRASYKGKAQQDLMNILQKLQKDVNALKKGSKQGAPQKGPKVQPQPKKEAFPEEEDVIALPTTAQEALVLIAEIRSEMNQRNIMLDEMMNQPGKLYFTD